MRALAAGLTLFVLGTALASARTTQTKVRVVLKVARICKVSSPATLKLDPTGRPFVPLASVLSSGCITGGVPATLTVRIDPAEKAHDVATLNF